MSEGDRNNSLPRRERLRGHRCIESLFKDGIVGFIFPFRYVVTTQPAVDDSHAGVSVLITAPKRNHKRANVRNLLKRRTREAFRQNKHPLTEMLENNGKHMHIALIYSSKEVEEYKTIENGLRRIIARLASQPEE